MVRIAWGVLALLLGVLLCFAWQGPDIFYHLYLGQRVLETGSFQPPDELMAPQPSYRNVYWLFQLATLGAWRSGGLVGTGGVVGASVFLLLAWSAVVAIWARTAGLFRYPAVGLPLAIIGVLVFQNRFEPRPEIFSYLFLIVQIHWLATWRFGGPRSVRRHLAFIVVQVLWVNVHGYFVLGPALVALRLIAALLERPARDDPGNTRRARTELAQLLVLVTLAGFVSPFGAGAWAFAIHLARFLQEMRGEISEFLPPTGRYLKLWTVQLFWVSWGLTAAAGVWVLVSRHTRRAGSFALLAAAAGLAISASSARNMPLVLLFAAPLWAVALDALAGAVPFTRNRRRAARRVAALRSAAAITPVLAGLAALALSAWVMRGGFHRSLMSETRFGIALPGHASPVAFTDRLRENPWAGRIFNSAADGGYLEFHHPNVRVYMDSRYVEAAPVREYFTALGDHTAFRRLHARHGFEGALLKVIDSGRLVLSLMQDPEWEPVWGDLHRIFFVPRGSVQSVKARGDAGDSPTAGRVRFYAGEDLSERVHGRAAIQWAGILAQLGDRAGFLEALDQFADAAEVPSYVIQYALQWGLRDNDAAMIARARLLAPRMLALIPENRATVEQLLRVAAAQPMPGLPR